MRFLFFRNAHNHRHSCTLAPFVNFIFSLVYNHHIHIHIYIYVSFFHCCITDGFFPLSTTAPLKLRVGKTYSFNCTTSIYLVVCCFPFFALTSHLFSRSARDRGAPVPARGCHVSVVATPSVALLSTVRGAHRPRKRTSESARRRSRVHRAQKSARKHRREAGEKKIDFFFPFDRSTRLGEIFREKLVERDCFPDDRSAESPIASLHYVRTVFDRRVTDTDVRLSSRAKHATPSAAGGWPKALSGQLLHSSRGRAGTSRRLSSYDDQSPLGVLHENLGIPRKHAPPNARALFRIARRVSLTSEIILSPLLLIRNSCLLLFLFIFLY